MYKFKIRCEIIGIRVVYCLLIIIIINNNNKTKAVVLLTFMEG